MFIFRLYDDESIWNVRPDDDWEANDQIPVSSFSANRIELRPNSQVYAVLEGNFTGNNPRTLGEVGGEITKLTAYHNGQMIEYKEWAPGFSMHDFAYGGYEVDTAILDGNDVFQGSLQYAMDDVVQGLDGNDVFIGFGDSAQSGFVGVKGDIFFGGNGVDTSVYRGKLSEYQILQNVSVYDERVHNGSFVTGVSVRDSVGGRDGYDELVEVERLQFDDFSLAFDVTGAGLAGDAYRLYQAAFARTPDTEGLGYWINALDIGVRLLEVSENFIVSNEFNEKYGADLSNEGYINALYWNVLGREADQSGLDYWTTKLEAGQDGRADMLIHFSNSDENRELVSWEVMGGVVYENFAPVDPMF